MKRKFHVTLLEHDEGVSVSCPELPRLSLPRGHGRWSVGKHRGRNSLRGVVRRARNAMRDSRNGSRDRL